MKRLLQFFTLLTLALVGGAQTVLAETTNLYERTSSTWVDDDIADWGNSSATIANGLSQTGTNAGWSASKTFTFNAFSKVKLEATIIGGAATGRDTSYDYITFGGISLRLYGSASPQKATIDIDGTSYDLSGYTRNGTYNLTVTIDQATGEVAYNVSGSATGSGTVKSITALTGVTVGHLRGGRENYPATVTLSSIKVTEEQQEISIAKYTVNYVFESNIIKTESGEIAVNNVVEATLPITIDDQKYYATDGTITSLTVSNDETKNVLNVELRKAYDYNYTVKSNLGGDIFAAGINVEGEKVYAPYPRYINNNGVLYTKAANGSEYRYVFELKENDQIETLEYKDANINDVVYFSEGENITGATATSAGNNMIIRSSNAACGYASEDLTLVSLEPGKYAVKACLYSNSSAGLVLSFAYGDNTFTFEEAGSTNGTVEEKEIEVREKTDFIWKASGSAKDGLDYIYIQRTGDATVSIDLPADYTYSTFSSTANLDFANNADVEAYIAQVENDGVTVTLTKVEQVPAGEGVILKKIGDNTTAAVKVLASAEALSNNALVGVTEANTVSLETLAAAGNAYVLVSDEKFSKVSEGASGYISAGKAYLEYTPVAGASVNSLRISFGEPTAVADVEAKQETGDNAIYNVQGIRVSKPTAPGMYIMNGKAFIVK